MTKDLIIQGMTCTRPIGTKLKYFSTAVTSGNPEQNKNNNLRWIEEIRNIEGGPVLDPSVIIFPSSWTQIDIMDLWFGVLYSHVDRLIMSPSWKSSTGAKAEWGYALDHGIDICYYNSTKKCITPGDMRNSW